MTRPTTVGPKAMIKAASTVHAAVAVAASSPQSGPTTATQAGMGAPARRSVDLTHEGLVPMSPASPAPPATPVSDAASSGAVPSLTPCRDIRGAGQGASGCIAPNTDDADP